MFTRTLSLLPTCLQKTRVNVAAAAEFALDIAVSKIYFYRDTTTTGCCTATTTTTTSRRDEIVVVMPGLCVLCCLFVTVAVTAVTLTALFGSNSTAVVDGGDAAASSNDDAAAAAKRNDPFGFLYFFGNNRTAAADRPSKPDFITTFDTLRLASPKYAMKQFYCIVNERPCDPVGLRLKASISEEINADCKRCTRMETSNIRRISSYVRNNYPEVWRRIESLYKNTKDSYPEKFVKNYTHSNENARLLI